MSIGARQYILMTSLGEIPKVSLSVWVCTANLMLICTVKVVLNHRVVILDFLVSLFSSFLPHSEIRKRGGNTRKPHPCLFYCNKKTGCLIYFAGPKIGG